MKFFARRDKAVNIRRLIRRIRDLTIPNYPPGDGPRRQDRANRAIPALVVPWEDNSPVLHEAVFAITSDVSDYGVGLIMQQPFPVRDLLVCYWTDPNDAAQPWFFLAESRRNESIGGGFWTLGVEFEEYVNDSCATQLRDVVPLARQLLPDAEAAVASV